MKKFQVLFAVLLCTMLVVINNNNVAQTKWAKYNGSPVLLSGSEGEWDAGGCAGYSVILDGSTYKMWYGAWDGSSFEIGYATSSDGINWTKYNDPLTSTHPYLESDPVLNTGPGAWESVFVYYPQVYFDGNTYHMWYAGSNGLSDLIGYATSSDGITWIKYGNPVLGLGTSGSWDEEGVSPAAILFNGTTYEMIYNGFDGLHYQGGYATSTDGIDWTKSANTIISFGPSGSWDYPYTHTGSVVYNENTDLYYLFYSGGDFPFFKIGMATSPSFAGPWTKASNNPVLDVGPAGSWDNITVAWPCVIYDGIDNEYKMWFTGGSDQVSGSSTGLATSYIVVPVELTSFSANAFDQKVILNWSTATELNNQGFDIQRKYNDGEYTSIGFVKGQGTTTAPQQYSFVDKNLINGKYFYRLKQVDYDGTFEYSKVVDVDWKAFNSYLLEQNYPNPFNPNTTISFGLKEKSNVKITVLNTIGEEVAVILDEEKETGYHNVDFNATNLPSGVYFYQLKAGSFVQTKKMVLLR